MDFKIRCPFFHVFKRVCFENGLFSSQSRYFSLSSFSRIGVLVLVFKLRKWDGVIVIPPLKSSPT